VVPIHSGDAFTLIVPKIDCLEVTTHPSINAVDLQRCDHLRNIDIPILPDENILLSIEVDLPHVFWTLKMHRGNVGEPFVERTLFGLILDRSRVVFLW